MSDERHYLQTRLDELTGQMLKADAVISRVTRELRQRRQAFGVLSELHRTITTDLAPQEVYTRVLGAVQSALKMDRSVILERDGDTAVFRPVNWAGGQGSGTSLQADVSLLEPHGSLLAIKSAAVTPFVEMARNQLGIAFFVAVPICLGNVVRGLLISGRQREMKPFYPPLDEQDINTLASLAGFLGSALSNSQLFETQRKLTVCFRRFVPREFLEILQRDSILDVQLGDQVQRTMSILFSDIRSFTTLSETMTPKENFDFLNRYLEFVAPAVLENGGFIDKYIGDAIMALFPDADSAVRAAVGLHAGLAAFNASRGGIPIVIGAGVHTGPLMLGTIGFPDRMDTTVIADAVNLASRLESLTKTYGAGVLISGDTARAMKSSFSIRTVDHVTVKGKNSAVEIIEVLDADTPSDRKTKQASLPTFKSALQAYTAGNFATAASGFAAIHYAHPQDGAAALLLRRCKTYQENPPNDWCGVVAVEK